MGRVMKVFYDVGGRRPCEDLVDLQRAGDRGINDFADDANANIKLFFLDKYSKAYLSTKSLRPSVQLCVEIQNGKRKS